MSKSVLRPGRPSASVSRQPTLTSLVDDQSLARVHFELRRDLHTKLKIYAARRKMTVRGVLTSYIENLPE